LVFDKVLEQYLCRYLVLGLYRIFGISSEQHHREIIPAARAGRIAVYGEKQIGLPFAGFPPDGFESSVVFRPI
jgi:hypothetical protein